MSANRGLKVWVEYLLVDKGRLVLFSGDVRSRGSSGLVVRLGEVDSVLVDSLAVAAAIHYQARLKSKNRREWNTGGVEYMLWILYKVLECMVLQLRCVFERDVQFAYS